MTANAEGVIYAASENGDLISYIPSLDERTIYPQMGYGASGDLTFYQQELYMATTDNSLVKLDPENPDNNEVVIDFSNSGASIFGIVSTVEDCQVKTYAISGGASAQVYQIDWDNLEFNFVCTLPRSVYGGTSAFEFLASDNPIAIDSIFIDQQGCDQAINNVTISATSANPGPLNFAIDEGNFGLDSIFTDLSLDRHIVDIIDGRGCEYRDSFEVLAGGIENIMISAEPTVCGQENGIISITAESLDTDLSIYIDNEIRVDGLADDLAVGEYRYRLEDTRGCVDSGIVTIDSLPSAELASITLDETNCGLANGSIHIEYEPTDMISNYTIQGNTNSTGIFPMIGPGEYQILVEDINGCQYAELVELEDTGENCDLYIPNVFSPNNDNINDRFKIYSEYDIVIDQFRIYDRWGNLVFTQENKSIASDDFGWDGLFQGEEVVLGIYSYHIQLSINGNSISRSGSVKVSR